MWGIDFFIHAIPKLWTWTLLQFINWAPSGSMSELFRSGLRTFALPENQGSIEIALMPLKKKSLLLAMNAFVSTTIYIISKDDIGFSLF